MLGTHRMSAATVPDVIEATRVALDLVRGGIAESSVLAERLYATWYAQAVTSAQKGDPPVGLPTDLAAVLRTVHAASDRWETGWVVERVGPAGKAAVARDGERRVVYRGDYLVPDHPGLAGQPGDRVVANARRDLVDPDGAWWRTRGPSWSDAAPPTDLVRLYWNVGIVHVPHLVEQLTAVLDHLEGPWMLKCAVDIAQYGRADAVVAYLRRANLYETLPAIDRVRAAVESIARAGHPPFTLPVGPGLAIADDPGHHQSFGEHRCRLVAEGALTAGAALRSTASSSMLAGAVEAVHRRFIADGIDPRRPWAAGPELLPWEPA